MTWKFMKKCCQKFFDLLLPDRQTDIDRIKIFRKFDE